MNVFTLVLIIFVWSTTITDSSKENLKLYVPSGRLHTHAVVLSRRAFVALSHAVSDGVPVQQPVVAADPGVRDAEPA